MVTRLSSTYQAPPLTSEEVESMLKASRYARVCTHNKDGTIHAVPVAYGYVNGQILIMSFIKSRKNKNIERNNNVTVLIDTLNPVTRGVIIYGTAHIEYENVYEQVLKINETSPAFSGMTKEKLQLVTKAYVDTWRMVILKISPKHFVTFDYAKDEAWNNFLKTYFTK